MLLPGGFVGCRDTFSTVFWMRRTVLGTAIQSLRSSLIVFLRDAFVFARSCTSDQLCRVQSCRRATNNSRDEIGVVNQETSTADRGQKVYKINGLEALGNKASPRERCPRGQRPQCFAQDMDGLKRKKKQPGKGSQNPRTKRATTAGKSGPTAVAVIRGRLGSEDRGDSSITVQ